MPLTDRDRETLLRTAWTVIERGAMSGARSEGTDFDFSGALLETRASFLTLRREEQLRGCCGTVWAHRPLGEDVVANAWTTAFGDPRFPPVRAREIPELSLEVSLLSPMEVLAADDLEDLAEQLEPGRDGLLVRAAGGQATFLPKVWDSLPEKGLFLDQLWRKAGWPAGSWPEGLQCWRYQTEVFGELE